MPTSGHHLLSSPCDVTPEFANQTRAERVLALEHLAGLGTFVGAASNGPRVLATPSPIV